MSTRLIRRFAVLVSTAALAAALGACDDGGASDGDATMTTGDATTSGDATATGTDPTSATGDASTTGDATGGDLGEAYRDGIDRINGIVADLCVCTSDPNGEFCMDAPGQCAPDAQTCADDAQFTDQAVIDCQVEALEAAPDGQAFLDCFDPVLTSMRACVDDLDASCPTTDVGACGQLFNDGFEVCLQNQMALDDAFQACATP